MVSMAPGSRTGWPITSPPPPLRWRKTMAPKAWASPAAAAPAEGRRAPSLPDHGDGHRSGAQPACRADARTVHGPGQGASADQRHHWRAVRARLSVSDFRKDTAMRPLVFALAAVLAATSPLSAKTQ